MKHKRTSTGDDSKDLARVVADLLRRVRKLEEARKENQ